jgi:hypothetical protein
METRKTVGTEANVNSIVKLLGLTRPLQRDELDKTRRDPLLAVVQSEVASLRDEIIGDGVMTPMDIHGVESLSTLVECAELQLSDPTIPPSIAGVSVAAAGLAAFSLVNRKTFERHAIPHEVAMVLSRAFDLKAKFASRFSASRSNKQAVETTITRRNAPARRPSRGRGGQR